MSLRYSLAEMRNPMRPEEPKKFYAKSQVRDVVSLNRIADEISYATALTDGDVLNVLRGLIRKVKEHLADGDIVDLEEFGKFQYQISSRGAESKEKFTPANIRKVRLQFRPCEFLKPSLKHLKFERVLPVKTRKAAESGDGDTGGDTGGGNDGGGGILG
ncbi:MAG: HU family DNA-binding protein [Bacteroides sp.]|nr:HU family DNA-binding protein [Bacteroides sp.]